MAISAEDPISSTNMVSNSIKQKGTFNMIDYYYNYFQKTNNIAHTHRHI